jgi:hypothetical protein
VTGYEVRPDALRQAAKGINDTISELKTLGIVEEAETGRGFGSLELTGMQVGHQGLQQAFSEFCDRWSWGVRTLVQDGSEIATRLGLAAGIYNDMEQYGVGVLKDAASDLGGDPHASDEQVENESWQRLAAANTPDDSAQSWQKAGDHMAATWQAEGRDLAEGPMGLTKTVADAAGQGDTFARGEDAVFGPAQGNPQSK